MAYRGPKVLIILAGVPQLLASSFRPAVKALEQNRRKIIWLPMKQGGSYDQKYLSNLYNDFYGIWCGLFNDKILQGNLLNGFLGVVTIYLEHGCDQKLVRSLFGIETLALGVPLPQELDGIGGSQSTLNKVANQFTKKIRKAIRQGEKLLPAIFNEVTTRSNRTPFLLPERNFSPNEIQSLSVFVSDCAKQETPPFDAVRKVAKSFAKQFPRANGARNQKHFKNQKGVLFQGPGTARHGMAVDSASSAKHKKQCLIRGRIRFGAAYDPTFHYDCVRTRGQLARLWESCHQQEFILPRERNHINIAPNDNVR